MVKHIALVLAFVLSIVFSAPAFAARVKGYTKSNGTYVSGYNRSSGDGSVRNNYSYYGNSNPYTGSTGTNKYRKSKSSEYYQGY